MLTVRADEDQEVTVIFPRGIAITLTLAGKSVDIKAVVGGRPALVRSDLDALPLITVDVVERRGPEEDGG